MAIHKRVKTFTNRLANHEFGGAAEVAENEVLALQAVIMDSKTTNINDFTCEVDDAIIEILRNMHSLAPPINALHRIMGTVDSGLLEGLSLEALQTKLIRVCTEFIVRAKTSLERVAEYGSEIIREGDVVFTFSMSSTVWSIFQVAKARGKSFSVIVTEARPTNEGFRTVTEIGKLGIPISISIDAAVGELVPLSDLVIIGADAISSSGTSLCKSGSYPTALVAKAHGIPFFVAADTLKFDPTTLVGLPFRPREIERNYILSGDYSDNIEVVGHYFDETPPELTKAIITEIGVLHPSSCISVMREMALSDRLNSLLIKRAHNEL